MATWETVCEMLADLPAVEITPPGGERVAVRTEYPTRAALIAEDPGRYGVTPHYETYPAVLVRLPAISSEELRELLVDAWRLIAPKRVVREFLET